jgi:NADH:ubiquinone oxidoreductase subunit 5 (subunit L)/multisubunit Na+/H+ antiporter MnhA subunit
MKSFESVNDGMDEAGCEFVARRIMTTAMAMIVRLVSMANGNTSLVHVLIALALFSMTYGNMVAVIQKDFKRLLAYSSISQMGYIFFGITMGSVLSMTGGIFHIINHATCKALLFMVAGIIMHQTHTRDLKQLGGMAGKMPMTAIACLIGVLALAGTGRFVHVEQRERLHRLGQHGLYARLARQRLARGLARSDAGREDQ